MSSNVKVLQGSARGSVEKFREKRIKKRFDLKHVFILFILGTNWVFKHEKYLTAFKF